MKTRKMFLVLAIIVALLLGSVLVASASDLIRITGGANNTYFGMGWEWMGWEVTLDPAAPPDDNADGKVRYRVYVHDGNPRFWESWVGEPVCGALGEFNGAVTVAMVIRVTEVKNIDPYWEGKYMKVTVTDGGQNASKDIIGIAAFDYDNMVPLVDQPECDFEEPVIWYPSLNGNLMIHD